MSNRSFTPFVWPLRPHSAVAVFAALCALAPMAWGVILFDTADPTANTAEPTGDLAGSGWQYEGQWGSFLGTPIAPQFFISAAHLGQQGSVFTFQGLNYTIVRSYSLANSDLLIWQVAETFPSFAPLYTKSDEVNQPLVVFGRGTQRGDGVYLNDILQGWSWGAADHVQRWGENLVANITSSGTPDNDFLYATFDQNGLPNEAQLSAGDSGGAVFLDDNGTWKLAGINYAVDGPYYTDGSGGGAFNAALFDARGFWIQNDTPPPDYVQIMDANPLPSGFYATRISSKLGWIYSVIDPTGNVARDGIPNLLKYALDLNPLASATASLPKAACDGTSLSLTYTKVLAATDITYTVEQSTDLINWTTANSQDTVLATNNGIQTIKASVVMGANNPLFLRLRVTRP